MPRAAPDQVHVHRIELGTWERTHLEEMQRTDDTEDAIRLALEAAQALAMPVALAATGYLAYLGLVEFQTGRDRLREWWTSNVADATGEPGDLGSRLFSWLSGLDVFGDLDERNPNL